MSEKKVFFICLTHYRVNSITSPFYIKGGGNNGIGNMLFQISSGLYYAYKNNAELHVPSLRTYFRVEDLKKEDTIFRKINTDIIEGYDENRIITSNYNKENIFIYPFENKMVLSNYFENYDNFNEYKEVILDYFRPNQSEKDYLMNKYPILKNDNLCSLHVRRGVDYNQLFTKDYLDNLERCYFEMVDYMIQNKNITNFFILTNDKEYSKKIFNNNEKYANINFYYSDERDFYDIWIISLIKNNLVSLSTLAWWGSYLNENNDKLIVSHTKMGGVYNPEWLYIN
jgi:hypothetical protein